jgi:hypothetical protein
LQHNHHTHQSQHDLFQPWVFAKQYCDVSDEGNEADDASYDVFFAVKERLAGRVKFGVIGNVVVTFGEEAERCFAASLLATSFPKCPQVLCNFCPQLAPGILVPPGKHILNKK